MAKGVKIKRNTIGPILQKIRKGIPDASKVPLSKQGQILSRLAGGLTPIEEGTLVGSRFVNPVVVTPAGAKVVVGYTDPKAPIIHARVEVKHTVGTALFLKKAVDILQNRVLPGLGKDTEIAIRGLATK